tara:strand:+ start:2089 stop:2334 length:246 start_codon:yes stop_codon:yes gene_type:complete
MNNFLAGDDVIQTVLEFTENFFGDFIKSGGGIGSSDMNAATRELLEDLGLTEESFYEVRREISNTLWDLEDAAESGVLMNN